MLAYGSNALCATQSAQVAGRVGCTFGFAQMFLMFIIGGLGVGIVLIVLYLRKRNGLRQGKGEATADIRKEKEKAENQQNQAEQTEKKSDDDFGDLDLADFTFDDTDGE